MPSHCRQSQLCLLLSVLMTLTFDFLSRQDVQASCICIRFGLPPPRCGGFSLRLELFLGTSSLPVAGSRSRCPDMWLESLDSLVGYEPGCLWSGVGRAGMNSKDGMVLA